MTPDGQPTRPQRAGTARTMYWRAVDRDSSIPNTTTCESPSSSTSLELSTTTALMSPAGRPAAATAAGSGRTEHQVCGHRGHGHSGQARPVPREGGGSTLRPPFFGELKRAELAEFLGVGLLVSTASTPWAPSSAATMVAARAAPSLVAASRSAHSARTPRRSRVQRRSPWRRRPQRPSARRPIRVRKSAARTAVRCHR
jgi:hypothetical protein